MKGLQLSMLEPEEEGADSHNGSVITSHRVDLAGMDLLFVLNTGS